MSRSRRKQPFSSICGIGSAKRDKVAAHRSERRTQNKYLKSPFDPDIFLFPSKRECPLNNVYGWNRDGNQMYKNPAKYGHEQWFVEMLRK